ncbi:MAG: anhydro-N-acetylmuramic acid kinase [Lactobacillaceae bacterium]|jgi:anhydro-N-acetylmuramic acid kinase|nr:anhydro-N-acetylmuramic acid kinase [Lactobacillaceae bacterium]
MNSIKPLRALGIMSGTSADGVGLSLISTDGVDVYEFLGSMKFLYDDNLKAKIISVLGKKPETENDFALIHEVNAELAEFYYEAVKDFMSTYGEADIIGLEGNTVYHDPQNHYTYQLGDAKKLSSMLGIKVVSNFHKTDVLSGGQGFPLTPSYYAALSYKQEKPVAIINIGGITSIAWIGMQGEMLSFDSGPGNLAINNWVQKHGGISMDYNGKLAITGKIDGKVLNILMKHKYLAVYPPKSLNKSTFDEKLEHLEGLSLEDGAATVTAFIAEAVSYSMSMYLPETPKKVIITGGGAENPTLVRFIKQRLFEQNVETVMEMGMNVDEVDSGAAAFWAVRRLNLLPVSFPSTTGVPEPLVGGDVFEP